MLRLRPVARSNPDWKSHAMTFNQVSDEIAGAVEKNLETHGEDTDVRAVTQKKLEAEVWTARAIGR